MWLHRLVSPTVLAAMLPCSVAPSGVQAQADSAAFSWSSVPRLAQVRLRTAGTFLIGRFVAGGRDTIVLSSCGQRCASAPAGRLRVPLSLVTAADLRRGSQALKGLAVGVPAGALLGAAVGVVVGQAGELRPGETVGVLALNGALLGAIVGPLIGSTIPRWRPFNTAGTRP